MEDLKEEEKIAIGEFVRGNYPEKIREEIIKNCKILGRKKDFLYINVGNELLIINQKGNLFDYVNWEVKK